MRRAELHRFDPWKKAFQGWAATGRIGNHKLLLLKPWGPAALLGWYDKLMPGERPADHTAHKAALKANLAKPGHWAAFQRTSHTTHAPVEARLGEVRAPALVVMGDRDPDFKDPAAEASWIAGRVGGTVVMVPGTGHYPQAQAPDVVNPAVLTFLAEALPVGGASAVAAGA